MGISHHIDIFTADAPKSEAPPAPHQQTPEPVAVAPDPALRIIIVAKTKTAGTSMAAASGIEPAAIVTPRAPHAARGLTADDIIWANNLTHEERTTLEPEVLPALATSGE